MPDDEPAWQSPPSRPTSLQWTLDRDDVHVWLAALDLDPAATVSAALLLSTDECERAQRFHFNRDRAHYTAARGGLRSLLGSYTGLAPADITFQYGPHGKPFLAPAHATSDLRFNMSHSRDYALYAFARNRDLGVDIEHMQALPDADRIAGRFFSPYERATLRSLPPDQQHAAFYAAWTRKEAYIKAAGKGLAQPLDEFDVSLAPDTHAQLLRVAGSPDEAHRWQLRALPAPAGYAAALAVEGVDCRLTLWRWRSEISR